MLMDVAGWFAALMVVVVATAWLQTTTKIPGRMAEWAWELVLKVFCAMMRHSGDPAYAYKGRHFA
jgi:hypothetical protein